MKAYEYLAYTLDASVYCATCGPGPKTDGAHPIGVGEEWDYIPVCDECGAEHDYVILPEEEEEEEEEEED